jgi:hypothetical protein
LATHSTRSRTKGSIVSVMTVSLCCERRGATLANSKNAA